MSAADFFYYTSEKVLFIPFMLMLFGSIILSFKMRFIQIRLLPRMFNMLFRTPVQQGAVDQQTIPPHQALFTAMSTTIGVGNLTGPIIALGLGGPGALIGFVLATIFGCAATFVEVTLALTYRRKEGDRIIGGPMEYLRKGLGEFWGNLYAYAGFVLLVAWSSAQSNTLAVLLEPHGIARSTTGILLAIAVIIVLFGGIKRIGELNEKLVPFMFILYCFATSWIIVTHAHRIPAVMSLIFHSVFTPSSAAGAVGGFSMYQALRHGLARGFNANEAGIGTATFPHSMAQTNDVVQQGILAMVSVYANGILCLLTAFVVLLTGVFQIPEAHFDITMLSKALEMNFPFLGSTILVLCSILFAFGTILGNAYNGSQCFLFATNNRFIAFYYMLTAVVVFLGSMFGVRFIWTMMDFFVLPVAVPHMIGIVILAFKQERIFKIKSK